jgi:hypothetical protein
MLFCHNSVFHGEAPCGKSNGCLQKLLNNSEAPKGWRYPLVDGTRQRRFAGTNFKPNKLLENAQTPTSWVHGVLGAFLPLTYTLKYT